MEAISDVKATRLAVWYGVPAKCISGLCVSECH